VDTIVNTTAPAVTETSAATENDTNHAGKEAIYGKLADFVLAKTGKRIGKAGGRVLFDMAIDEIFALATRDGTVRLNGGFGSFHIRDYTEGSRRLPSGQEVTFGPRKKLRYEEGVVVKALVANGGNLEEAYKVRGTRAKEEEVQPAAAAPAAPPVPAGDKLD
jgi:nucleoid DNA-binding protein